MKGGTYAEALKVGFTEEQAGFISRMGMETKNEAVDMVFSEIKHRKKKSKWIATKLRQLADKLDGVN